MSIRIPFDNSYARLPERFYLRQSPRPAAMPELMLLNLALCDELGLDAAALRGPERYRNSMPMKCVRAIQR